MTLTVLLPGLSYNYLRAEEAERSEAFLRDFVHSSLLTAVGNGCPAFTSPSRIIIIGPDSETVRQQLVSTSNEIDKLNFAIAGDAFRKGIDGKRN